MGKLLTAPEELTNHSDKRDITGTNLVSNPDKRGLDVKNQDLEDQLDGLILEDPLIYNVNYGTANTIVSQVLSEGTKKFTVKHRGSKSLDLGWVAGLATYIVIPAGVRHPESGLRLSGKTIYFRSGNTGIIEIVEWT